MKLKGELDCTEWYDRGSLQNQQLYRWSRLSPFDKCTAMNSKLMFLLAKMWPREELEQL